MPSVLTTVWLCSLGDSIDTHLYFIIMVARYLNNDKKAEIQIRETGYKVRQTVNHIRGQTGTSL